ncbi:MAG: glycoside hydrolase family 5 protein [Verrucomicrobiia bacterium]
MNLVLKCLSYLLAAFLLICGLGFHLNGQVKRGAIVYENNFEEPNVLNSLNLSDAAAIQLDNGYKSDRSLKVKSPSKNGSSNVVARIKLNVDGFKNCTLLCEAMVRAQNVSKPPNPWNGVKFMLIVEGDGKEYLQKNAPTDSFDWQKIQFLAKIPEDVKSCELVVGLELATGEAWFDDIKITVRRAPLTITNYKPSEIMYKGHNLPRLRGTMIGTRLTTNDFITLGKEWNANHVRWQLTWGGFPHSPADDGDLEKYDKWLSGELERIDRMLPVCREAGILVLIDLHTPPGGRNRASECMIFQDKKFQESFLKWWEQIARRYKGEKTIWGYDLMNEPVSGAVIGEGCLDWNELALEAAKRIRAIDPEHAIIVEPEPWGDPKSIDNIEPLPVPGIVYSVHMYRPHKFTHQGVYDTNSGIAYPGVIDGKYWDKSQLRKELEQTRAFQKKYNVHIYIGEFSAIRWAPGKSAYNYLSDLIDIFEEYGWDWCYHAFREWEGWSVEHGQDKSVRTKSPQRTDREELLRFWFSKNMKPKW